MINGGIGPIRNGFDHVKAISVAHLDVEQDGVRAELADLGMRLGAAAGFTDMLHLRKGLKQQPEAPQGQGFIVDRHDTERSHAVSRGRES